MPSAPTPDPSSRTAEIADTPTIVHFSVDASVIFQLGERLISDAVQALMELIKNAYDADAESVLVEVDTQCVTNDVSGTERIGRVVITDDGDGMTEHALLNGWLRLSTSFKRSMKRDGVTTRRGRTPLGEKGLGRLGAQRLGHYLEIETTARTAPREAVITRTLRYCWDDFEVASALEDVPIAFTESEMKTTPGTTLTITQLKELDAWRDGTARAQLDEGISQLYSPYTVVQDFAVDIVIDNVPLELARVGDEILDAAHVHYEFAYDGQSLSIIGRVKRAFFRPPSGTEKLTAFDRHVEVDQGRALAAYLLDQKSAKELELRRADKSSWFLEFSTTIKVSDLKLRGIASGPHAVTARIADPGPFSGRVDSFDFGAESAREQTVFDKRRAFASYVKRFSGIRVFRDGFGIRTDRDWLGLAQAGTSGSSYYSLRPYNTMGYVTISASGNPNLLEKTDREGFQVTPHYENFHTLLRGFVLFTDDAQARLRRTYNEFAKRRFAADADVPPETAPTVLADQIRARLAQAASHRQSVASDVARISADVAGASEAARRFADEMRTHGFDRDGAYGALEQLEAKLRDLSAETQRAAKTVRDLDDYLADVAAMDPVGALLRDQIETMESRVDELYEAASLGITAEALSHELGNIIEQLRIRTTRAGADLRGGRFTVDKAKDYLSAVQGVVNGIRKQLAHLAPALRYAREERVVMQMSEFLGELLDYHRDRIENRGLAFELLVRPGGDFTVRINRGKLVQVFDNLILNSEYWLTNSPPTDGEASQLVRVSVDQPFVYVSDTGPGVDPRHEHSLFQPFVTGKPKGVGRGLGLFIVERLLALDGCTIALGAERNARKRRYVFELNFAEVVHERA